MLAPLPLEHLVHRLADDTCTVVVVWRAVTPPPAGLDSIVMVAWLGQLVWAAMAFQLGMHRGLLVHYTVAYGMESAVFSFSILFKFR
jgi:hypothetical protein